MKKIYFAFASLFIFMNVNAQPGTLDPSFGSAGTAVFAPGTQHDVATDIVALPDTTTIICASTKLNNITQGILMHILSDGTMDSTFGVNGLAILNIGKETYPYELALQPDGKLVVVGTTYVTVSDGDVFIARFNSNGTLDTSFNSTGINIPGYSTSEEAFECLTIQPDGKIVCAGSTQAVPFSGCLFARFNTNGKIDNTFGTNGFTMVNGSTQDERIYSIGLLSSGNIIGGGYGYVSANFSIKSILVKLNNNGQPVSNFGTNGYLLTPFFSGENYCYGITVHNDSIFSTGYHTPNNSLILGYCAKFDSSGIPDQNFGSNGLTSFGSAVFNFGYNVLVQPDNKILVCGGSGVGFGDRDFILARFLQNGSPDAAFGTNGVTLTSFGGMWDEANAMCLQTDGKIVLAGFAPLGTNDIAMARYLNDITSSVGIPVLASQNSISVYPNPTHDFISINTTMSNQQHTIIITDNIGRVVSHFNVMMSDKISVQHLAPGFYNLSIIADGNIVKVPFVKQ
ncbi:MAG: T9SS type A sorting domain-containing protein [Bacteroidetes bacterium]|nr:T9SS type A sorting domain-containing protein [Bacteroidota bacterium]MBL0053512.1 T9SS type A sorting domain-containing protein [Bacteroidota bacterium]